MKSWASWFKDRTKKRKSDERDRAAIERLTQDEPEEDSEIIDIWKRIDERH